MMMIQVFSEYNKAVEAGRAKALTCPMHEDDIFLLTPYFTADERIGLGCFACGYKHLVGQSFYDQIKAKVQSLAISQDWAEVNESEKMDH